MAFFIHATKAQEIIPFLACAPGPFITQPPAQPYTLAIDFLQVFTSGKRPKKHGRELVVRPYSSYFIKEMARYYELVSFSNSMPAECNGIINAIDPSNLTRHRLYKYHCKEGRKDVGKMGRDPSKLILLDSVQDEANCNLLLVSGWKGEEDNLQLAEICPLLALVALKKLDTLVALQKIRQAARSNSGLGLKYINCGLAL